MRIDFVFPKLPPVLDGIGDHTACLTRAMAMQGIDVHILTAQENAVPIPGVTVERAFSIKQRRGVCQLLPAVKANPPDWLFLQFNQFSYGRWGLNPYLPLAMRRIKQRHPEMRIAVMFHEDFLPVTSWKNAVMTTWQRAQFWALGRQADVVGFSIEPWARHYQSWFPHAEVMHWPVGSNIPRVDVALEQVRSQLGITDNTFVAGVFGTLNASRPVAWIKRAVEAIHGQTSRFMLLYVGPDGELLKQAMPEVPVHDAGALPAEDVSRHLAAMDLHLTPFIDGASTRRGSFLAGLQHGVPTVSTCGPLTDALLAGHNGRAFLLAPVDEPAAFEQAALTLLNDADYRRTMGTDAQSVFDVNFGWSNIADRVLADLLSSNPHLIS